MQLVSNLFSLLLCLKMFLNILYLHFLMGGEQMEYIPLQTSTRSDSIYSNTLFNPVVESILKC